MKAINPPAVAGSELQVMQAILKTMHNWQQPQKPIQAWHDSSIFPSCHLAKAMRPLSYSSPGLKASPCPNDASSLAIRAGAIPPAGSNSRPSISAHKLPSAQNRVVGPSFMWHALLRVEVTGYLYYWSDLPIVPPISAWSHAIPNTTTEHEQVPTSITKKHNMSICYRRRAANVGGREMVLGRISDTGWWGDEPTVATVMLQALMNESCVCLFPQNVLCFHSGFHGDTTVETDANVASVGFDSRMRGNQYCVGAGLTFNHDLMKDSAVIHFPAHRQAILVKHNV